MDAGLVQIIVAIIGALSPIAQELMQRGGKAQHRSRNATGEEERNNGSITKNISGWKRRDFLELAITLLYSAFFSAIIADSLLVSGRVPTLEVSILFQIFIITLITTTSLLFAWYWQRSKTAVGIISITTLVVLVLSPGGPIRPAPEQGTEPGLSLIFPVFILSILASSSIIYSFGNPLAKNTPKNLRNKVAIFLSVLLVIGTLSLAQQFVSHVSENPKSPNFSGDPSQVDAATTLLKKVRRHELKDRGMLYELGSEIALSQYYRDSYFQVLSFLDFSNISRLLNEEGDVQQEQVNSSTLDNSSNSSNNSSDSSDNDLLQSDQSLSVNDSESNENDRIRILESISEYFSSNSFRQLSYLSDRAQWIHPSVSVGNSQLDFPLPGTTTEERLTSISDYRIFHAISKQQNLIDKFFDLFTYNRDIVSAFKPDPFIEERNSFSVNPYAREEESKFDKVSSRAWLDLFPDLPQSSYNNLLLQQLAFPLQDELFIAYSTYLDLAPTFYEEDIQTAAANFGNLNSETQRAFVSYIAKKQDSLLRFQVFSKIAQNLGSSPFPDIGNSITAALDLATAIEQGQMESDDASNNSESKIREAAKLVIDILQGDPNSKQLFSNVLKEEEPQIPIKSLLDKNAFSFFESVSGTLTDDHKETLFRILENPISPVIEQVGVNVSPYKDFDWFKQEIEDFISLDPQNQEAILHYLAISLYRAEGEYSLDPMSLLIFQAGSLNAWLLFCALLS
jgi:hypothetical protein